MNQSQPNQSQLTRRNVLKTGVAAAASLAIPYVITSNALGTANIPPASDRLTVGCIGVGGRGRGLLRSMRGVTKAEIVGVSDCYRSRCEPMAKVCNATPHADFRELLARDDIDAVVIGTPDHWHVPIALRAAAAGKDAYVEKPLGLSVEQTLLCRDTFNRAERIFQYGTQQRSTEPCWLGCELVRRGTLGTIRKITVRAPNGSIGGSTKPAAIPEDLDFQMWIGPAPETEYTVDRCKVPGSYHIYDYSIGYLGGWGAHPLDQMIWACDADQTGLIEIEGSGVIPTEGLYNTVVNWNMKGKFGDVDFEFTTGADLTTFHGDEGWISVRRGGVDASDKSWLETKIDPADAKLKISRNHMEDFVDSVLKREPAVAPVDDAARSDVISHLCDIAVRTGRKIKWDPQQETIVGDEDAAKHLHRDMRAPWTLI